MVSITLPTFTLNGTSPITLCEDYAAASTAISDAIAAVGRTVPNGRDYISQPDAYTKARDEHFARLAKLGEVAAEIAQLAIFASDAS